MEKLFDILITLQGVDWCWWYLLKFEHWQGGGGLGSTLANTIPFICVSDS